MSYQDLTDDEKREYLHLLETKRRILSKDSLEVFAEWQLGLSPAKHHKLIINKLEELERGDIDVLFLLLPPGSAKALCLHTPLPTPDGWKKIGDIKVGDQVFDEKGSVCNVVRVSDVWKDRPVYKVITDCGDTIIADKDHEWPVNLCRKGGDSIKKSWELCRERAKKPMIRRAGTLDLPRAELPIDPYVLGLWLGDGNSDSPTMTASVEDQPFLRNEIEKAGIVTSDRKAKYAFGMLGVRKTWVDAGLIKDVRLGINGRKHIPEVYLRASGEQRLSLLQGLVDSDGTVCKKQGNTTFTNTNLELIIQFRELVRTLGVKAGWQQVHSKEHKNHYSISFYLKDSARLPRKRKLTRNQQRTPNTYINVEEFGISDTVCITVDSPSSLFLCGDSMTPTHNSSYGSIVFPSWYLGRNPSKSVICASHTSELAEKFGRKVRNIVASGDFGQTFGGISVSKDSSAAGRWETSKGGEFFACGLGGSVTGRRADLGVIDDPVASREVADSETMRDKAWDWFVSDFMTRLKPGAKLLFIMTRWHEDDLGGRAIEYFGKRAHVIKIPMEAGKNDILGREEGDRLWPEWYTNEMVDLAKEDARAWSALYQQSPNPIGGGEFKTRWVNHYSEINHRPMTKIMLVDSSAGRKGKDKKKKKKGDFTCIWVIGLGKDDNYYALDIVRDRLNLTSRSNIVFKLHRKWKPEETRYEQYGMMADVEHIRGEMNRKDYRFPIIEVGGRVEKEVRIRRLIPTFQTGKFWMPKELWYTQENGEVVDLVDTFVNTEVVAFPVSRHDDMLDSLARIKEPTLDTPWPQEQQGIVPEMSYSFNY